MLLIINCIIIFLLCILESRLIIFMHLQLHWAHGRSHRNILLCLNMVTYFAVWQSDLETLTRWTRSFYLVKGGGSKRTKIRNLFGILLLHGPSRTCRLVDIPFWFQSVVGLYLLNGLQIRLLIVIIGVVANHGLGQILDV